MSDLTYFMGATWFAVELPVTILPLIAIVVALVACHLPARRAMRLDPLVALRHG